MTSGINTSASIRQAYQDVFSRKFSAVIIKLTDNDMEVVKTFPPTAGNPAEEWEKVIEDLDETEPRYIICDFQVKETELVIKSKLCLISYVTEAANIRSRMIYASTFVELCNELDPPKTIQATEKSDVKYDELKSSVFQK